MLKTFLLFYPDYTLRLPRGIKSSLNRNETSFHWNHQGVVDRGNYSSYNYLNLHYGGFANQKNEIILYSTFEDINRKGMLNRHSAVLLYGKRKIDKYRLRAEFKKDYREKVFSARKCQVYVLGQNLH